MYLYNVWHHCLTFYYPYFFLLGVEQIFNTCFCIKLLVIHYFLGYFIYTIFPYSLKIITTFTVFLTLLEPIEHFNRYINSGFKLFLLWIFIFHTFEILQGITFIFILPIITYISTHIYPFQLLKQNRAPCCLSEFLQGEKEFSWPLGQNRKTRLHKTALGGKG